MAAAGEIRIALSLRHLAGCIGVGGAPLSVLGRFFGYRSIPIPLSLRLQMTSLRTSRHVHLNMIEVATEAFSQNDRAEVDAAVQFTRDTFRLAGIAIGRVEHYGIPQLQANFGVIGNAAEAKQLTLDWTVPNDAVDAFVVRMYVGAVAGRSPVDGPCDKNSSGMNGLVFELNSSTGGPSNFALAHELCHYLGCDHVDNPTSLMNPTIPNGAGFSNGETFFMQAHCAVHLPCGAG